MRKAFIFDFDDTLAVTNCKIYVCDEHKNIVAKLNPKEFSEWELKSSEYFVFDEFRNKTFINNAEATFLLNLAKEVYEESHSVYILTAREDDVQAAIFEWLKSHGIIPKMVYCIGGKDSTIAQGKRSVLLSIMEKYDKCYYYDDNSKNIDEAPEGENFRKYQVTG